MLDHNEGIANIAQTLQRLNKPVVIALVQTNGRFIEHIKYTGQTGTNLRSQTDALCLAARKRGCAAIQGQVIQTDVQKEAQPSLGFLEYRTGNDFLAVSQHQRVQEFRGILNRKRTQSRNGLLTMSSRSQADSQDLRLQARAFTGAARHAAGVLQQAVFLGLRIGRFQLAVNETGRALKRRGPIALAPVAVLVPNLHLLVRAIDERVALLLGQFVHWRLRVKPHCLTQSLH